MGNCTCGGGSNNGRGGTRGHFKLWSWYWRLRGVAWCSFVVCSNGVWSLVLSECSVSTDASVLVPLSICSHRGAAPFFSDSPTVLPTRGNGDGRAHLHFYNGTTRVSSDDLSIPLPFFTLVRARFPVVKGSTAYNAESRLFVAFVANLSPRPDRTDGSFMAVVYSLRSKLSTSRALDAASTRDTSSDIR